MIQSKLPAGSARQWICAEQSLQNKNKLALCPFRAKPGRGVLGMAVLRQPMHIVSNVFCGYETLKHRAFLSHSVSAYPGS